MGWDAVKDVKLHLRQLFLLWRGKSKDDTYDWYLSTGLKMACQIKHPANAMSARATEGLLRTKLMNTGKEKFMKALDRVLLDDVPANTSAAPKVASPL